MIEENSAFAAIDVAGAQAQTQKLVRKGDSVLVLGAAGKSGILCCYEAKNKVGKSGKVIGLVKSEEDRDFLLETGFCDNVVIADEQNPEDVLNKVLEANENDEVDICINCANIDNTEMSSIMTVRDEGTVCFFSMATNFAKAVLGAKEVGKDLNMIMGNEYTKKHTEVTINALRESEILRNIFKKLYI
jgi:L-erythro-3,5-diaminohexanoate dehydrogenase